MFEFASCLLEDYRHVIKTSFGLLLYILGDKLWGLGVYSYLSWDVENTIVDSSSGVGS